MIARGIGWGALALIVGLVAAGATMGWRTLDPRDIGWLFTDPAAYYIGWGSLRQEPDWVWPLTFTDRLGHPLGVSTAILDAIPVLLIAFRLLGPALPEPFQYFGLVAIAAFSLQFLFGARLARALGGGPLLGISLGLLLVCFPPFMARFYGHFALVHHWLIVWCLLLYLRLEHDARAWRWRYGGVLVLACGINPYLLLMCGMIAGAALLNGLWSRRMSLAAAALTACAWFVVCAAALWGFGLLGADESSLSAAGAETRALDPVSLIDPARQSALFPGVELLNHLGFGRAIYLGVPGMILGTIGVIGGLARARARPARVVPLILASMLATLLAISPYPRFAGVALGDVPLPRVALDLLSAVRGAARFIWVPAYVAVIGGIVVLTRVLGRRAWMAVAVLAGVAVFETGAVRDVVRQLHGAPRPAPLRDPIWRSIGRDHDHLVVLPAWQCGSDQSPGGRDGYRVFGLLALEQRMTLNSYQSGRYGARQLSVHCGDVPERLRLSGPVARTAYVVTEPWLILFRLNPSISHHCGRVDGFWLCLHRDGAPAEFGVSEAPAIPTMPPDRRVPAAELAAHVPVGWDPVHPGTTGLWSHGDGAPIVGARLPAVDHVLIIEGYPYVSPGWRRQTVSVAVNGMEIGRIEFEYGRGPGRFEFTVPAAAIAAATDMTVIWLRTPEAGIPARTGGGDDRRRLGFFLQALTIAPR